MTKIQTLLNFSIEPEIKAPKRLPDLDVILESISHSEGNGAGLQIYYGIFDTPFGDALIATTVNGICGLSFTDVTDPQLAELSLRQSWSKAEITGDRQITQPLCDAIFSNNNALPKPLTLQVKGTDFQIQVWQELLKVPFGSTTTYQNIAEAIARPTAVRAVGNAVGDNPIAYVIPCHRVIRASGELGGYRWGLDRKIAILNWERTASFV